MFKLPKSFYFTVLILVFLSAIGKGQPEVFLPTRDISIVDFVPSANHRIIAISKEGEIVYSSGMDIQIIASNLSYKDIWITNDSIFIATDDYIYYLDDLPFVPTLKKVHQTIKSTSQKVINQGFSIQNDTIIRLLSGLHNRKILTKQKANDGYFYKDNLYITSKSGIFQHEKGNWKSYQIPGLDRYQNFDEIAINEHSIAISSDTQLFTFDHLNYQLSQYKLPKPISEITLNEQIIWALAGGDIYQIGTAEKSWDMTIGQLTVNDKIQPLDKAEIIINEGDELQISLDDRSVNSTGNSSTSYLLDGLDEQWKSYNQKALKYELSPGNYLLKAKFNRHDKTAYKDLLSIKVEPKTNHTLLYLLVGLVAVLLLFSLIQYYKHNASLNQLRQQIKLLQTENKLNKQRSKVLQLQIKPHFLFNALNNIQGLIVSGKPQEAKQQLRNFSLLMRSMLDRSEQDWITISEDIKLLKRYIELERINHKVPFDYIITTQSEDLLNYKIPPMLTQLLVENAIVHGIAKIQTKGAIDISYALNNDHIIVTVKDNGPGITEDKKESHHSRGSAIVNERLTLLGFEKSYQLENIIHNDIIQGCLATIKTPYK